MKIIRQINYSGKNLNDVFALPCVKGIIKVNNAPYLVLWRDVVRGEKNIARDGDTLVQYTNGKWSVE
jgi:hypothetical protein